MSERREQFDIDVRARIEVRLSSGRVMITRHEPGGVEIRVDGKNAQGFTIEQHGDDISVRQPSERALFGGSHRVSLRVPEDAELDIAVASADVNVSTSIGDLRVSTASGDVSAGSIDGDLVVKTASGDVKVDRVAGRVQVTAASGDFEAYSVGRQCVVTTASGDVKILESSEDMRIKTASGDVNVQRCDGSDFDCKTVSGDLRLGIPSGRQVHVDLNTMSGKVRLPNRRAQPSDSTELDSVRIAFRSVSGNVRLERA